MVKINDQVLAEAGIQLKNEKVLPVADLSEQLVLTLDGDPFRRRLMNIFDLAVPSGASAAGFLATYRAPKDAAIRWFAGSLSNANVKLKVLVTVQYTSPKGKQSVAYSFRDVQTGLQASFIGAGSGGTIPQPQYIANSIWCPPGGLLVLDFETDGGGNWNTNAFNWTIVGFTEPAPRTGESSEVLQPDKAIVVP